MYLLLKGRLLKLHKYFDTNQVLDPLLDAACLLLSVFLQGFGFFDFGILFLPEILAQVQCPKFFLQRVGWPYEEGYFIAESIELVEVQRLVGILELLV